VEFDVVRSAREARHLFTVGYGLIALLAGVNSKEFTWPFDLPTELV